MEQKEQEFLLYVEKKIKESDKEFLFQLKQNNNIVMKKKLSVILEEEENLPTISKDLSTLKTLILQVEKVKSKLENYYGDIELKEFIDRLKTISFSLARDEKKELNQDIINNKRFTKLISGLELIQKNPKKIKELNVHSIVLAALQKVGNIIIDTSSKKVKEISKDVKKLLETEDLSISLIKDAQIKCIDLEELIHDSQIKNLNEMSGYLFDYQIITKFKANETIIETKSSRKNNKVKSKTSQRTKIKRLTDKLSKIEKNLQKKTLFNKKQKKFIKEKISKETICDIKKRFDKIFNKKNKKPRKIIVKKDNISTRDNSYTGTDSKKQQYKVKSPTVTKVNNLVKNSR